MVYRSANHQGKVGVSSVLHICAVPSFMGGEPPVLSGHSLTHESGSGGRVLERTE
jgi:hypothetical protein